MDPASLNKPKHSIEQKIAALKEPAPSHFIIEQSMSAVSVKFPATKESSSAETNRPPNAVSEEEERKEVKRRQDNFASNSNRLESTVSSGFAMEPFMAVLEKPDPRGDFPTQVRWKQVSYEEVQRRFSRKQIEFLAEDSTTRTPKSPADLLLRFSRDVEVAEADSVTLRQHIHIKGGDAILKEKYPDFEPRLQ